MVDKYIQKKPIVYVDMDNVLVDFKSGIASLDEDTLRKYDAILTMCPGFSPKCHP